MRELFFQVQETSFLMSAPSVPRNTHFCSENKLVPWGRTQGKQQVLTWEKHGPPTGMWEQAEATCV